MTEIRVKAGSILTIKVKGPATVLIAQGGAADSLPAPDAAVPAGATMAGLGEAIALVAGRHYGIPTAPSDGIPPGSVAASLAILAAAFLRGLLPEDRGAQFLADLAKTASEEQGPAAEEGTR